MSTLGCEGDLTATSITPLITRVNLADVAGQGGVLFLPHYSMCVPPGSAHSMKEDNSLMEEDCSFVKGIGIAVLPC